MTSSDRTLERITLALTPGYRVDRELGAGGMATVYLAHDIKHDRDVAIKVLHPDLGAALGGERFLTEIRTTARLQHPHILPLLDSGDAGNGLLYYVMPLVTGETLRARLEREKQLPISDAIRIAREVASALDYAHRQNVIHRDIKPENILLHDGSALVADFGIALAVQSAGGARMTQTGLSLGTPQYMSPEQAMGERTIDARSDIYALGAVTYEMLAGDAPFIGSSVQAIVAKVLSEKPTSLHTLRDTVPPYIEHAVVTALAKLPADRYATAAEFAIALSETRGAPYEATIAVTSSDHKASVRAKRVSITSLAVAGAAIAVAVWQFSVRAPTLTDAARFVITLQDSLPLTLGGTERLQWGRPSAPAIAISPDGQTIVVAAMRSDANGPMTSHLYRRRIDDERLQVIPGTDSASAPFFSPTGREIGFFVGLSLRSVSLTGDSARRIADNIDGNRDFASAGAWGDDGSIVFRTVSGLWEVSGTGGVPRLLLADSGSGSSMTYGVPQQLSGGVRVLYQFQRSLDPKRAVLRLYDKARGTVTVVLENAMHGTVVGDSLLLFVRGGALLAMRFDSKSGGVTGEPVTVEENIAQAVAMPNTVLESGVGQYAISARGDLVVAHGGAYPIRPRIVLVRTPDGRARQLPLPEREYQYVRGSPTGDRLLLHIQSAMQRGSSGIALYDMTRNVVTAMTRGGYYNGRPNWSRDERRFLFQSDAGGEIRTLFVSSVDGGAPPERLTSSLRSQVPTGWLPDGTIIFVQVGAQNTYAIWLRSPDGTTRRWINSGVDERFPTLSPDGHRMAYVSGNQVFVRPFPGPGSAVAVSGVGATEPAWSPSGDQLYFVSTGDQSSEVMEGVSAQQNVFTLMGVDLSRDEPVRVGRARVITDSFRRVTGGTPVRNWDVMPDGSFVTLFPADTSAHADFNRAAIHEIHVSQHALRKLRFSAAASSTKR